MCHVAEAAQGPKGRVLRKKFVLSIKSWFFTSFFTFTSSLIITNMELRFEPCVLNLIWKRGAKDPKKEKTI
jgi:hypothetical protein